MRRPARRPHGAYTTTASEAPCRHCRRPLLYAWDEGLLARADASALDLAVATVLRGAGRRIYVLTHARNLIYESAERAGSLRLVRSRHAEHLCRVEPPRRAPAYEKLELFDLDGVQPVQGSGGMW